MLRKFKKCEKAEGRRVEVFDRVHAEMRNVGGGALGQLILPEPST
jgi:hypothetical protein